jgi:hypothetical protein
VLYVADTYNNKIKLVSIEERTAETFLGTGMGGFKDGNEAQFDEPGGLSVAGGTLYIADTNNHVIRVADIETRRVETLEIKDSEMLWPEPDMPDEEPATELAAQSVAPGEATLTISLELPDNHKLTPGAPTQLVVRSADEAVLRLDGKTELTFSRPTFPIEVPVAAAEGAGSVRISYAIYFCEDSFEGLCYFDGGALVLPVTVGEDGGGGLVVDLKVGDPNRDAR